MENTRKDGTLLVALKGPEYPALTNKSIRVGKERMAEARKTDRKVKLTAAGAAREKEAVAWFNAVVKAIHAVPLPKGGGEATIKVNHAWAGRYSA